MDNSKMDNWETDIWKMKNIQRGLVLRGCPASGQFQNSFEK